MKKFGGWRRRFYLLLENYYLLNSRLKLKAKPVHAKDAVKPASTGLHHFQVGALADKSSANRLAAELMVKVMLQLL